MKYKQFDDWFNEIEGYTLRSERFFDSLDQFNSKEGLNANLILWLKAAWDSAREKNND